MVGGGGGYVKTPFEILEIFTPKWLESNPVVLKLCVESPFIFISFRLRCRQIRKLAASVPWVGEFEKHWSNLQNWHIFYNKIGA